MFLLSLIQSKMTDVAADKNDPAGSLPNTEKEPDDLIDEKNQENQPAAAEEKEGEGAAGGVYRYIKGDLFTSEIFKVEIQNLPKYIGFNDLKKFLNKHGINPHKIKLFNKQMFAFVTFKNQEERDKAMKAVHGMQWKSKVLSVRLAKPKADPILKKRKQDEEAEGGQPGAKRAASSQEVEEDEEEPLNIQIANAVTPLWNVPYEEQLKRKEKEVEGVLQKLTRYFLMSLFGCVWMNCLPHSFISSKI